MKGMKKRYKGVKSIARKPAGGYDLIPVRSLLAVWHAYAEGCITLFDLRSWLACHEMLARRCQLEKDRIPDYSPEELATLTGSKQIRKVKRALRRLIEIGLLQWDANQISLDTRTAEQRFSEQKSWVDTLHLVVNSSRKVPVPRRIIRYLARTRSKTTIGTILGHLLRALYISKGMCVSGGRCKVSWIVSVLGLDPRNVKATRKNLIEMRWLQVCESSQVELNRWGLQVVINLHWAEPVTESKTPPPEAENVTKTPPPIYNKKLSRRSINQKPCRTSGVQKQTMQEKPPCLKHITTPDLTDQSRLDSLFWQAAHQGILAGTEACRLAWFAAAEHALIQGKQNPPGLFAAVVKNRLWHYINQNEENIARKKLRELDFGEESVSMQAGQYEGLSIHTKVA